MTSRNVEIYRAGHEAFNQRDFDAMTKQYADSITWTDHAQGRTFSTPQQFKDDFLPGWVEAASDIRITGPRYLRNGRRNPAEDRAARQAERARRRVRHRTA